MNQFFMNEKQQLVNEAIEGTLLSTPFHNLSRLALGNAMRVVVRSDWDRSKVALISGGGSGHEPAHIGFVGKGMLTAAVCGDVFASPSVDAVLHAIINVTGEAGCLLIVKNYTGDRLNFGLAAEKAKQLGYRVEMVMVRDDIALPDNPQPRGIAGTALVHKVAGYAAEQGQSLAEVTALAQRALEQTASIGVAFSSCHIPGEARDERVKPGSCELGMGIHGEPGASTLKTQNSVELVTQLLQHLAPYAGQGKLALLINNLGGFSVLEMAVLTREVLRSSLGKQIQLLLGPATLVSALDMKGFSLSVLQLDEELEQALRADVEAAGWSVATSPATSLEEAPATRLDQHKTVVPSANEDVAAQLITLCQTLITLESELNNLDAQVGDGDTGSTFAAGARSLLQACESQTLPLDQTGLLFNVIGEKLASVMGGSSGVLMSIMFTAAGQRLEQGESLPQALIYGLERMQHYGGARVGQRTMIDALQPAFSALAAGKDLVAVAAAAREGADSTSRMRSAGAGRASYLNAESLDGVKDPGAYAVEKVFAALAEKQA